MKQHTETSTKPVGKPQESPKPPTTNTEGNKVKETKKQPEEHTGHLTDPAKGE